ncbi:MAG TPA: hypothetical protein VGK25_08480 [Ignavibacteria bacterium]|jgi:hypothetical protein
MKTKIMKRDLRGSHKFEVNHDGHVVNSPENLEKLRKLFLDRKIINGKKLGPGDPGDFDFGAWHVLCHLAAGCAVFRNTDKYLWVEISHVPLIDVYTATVNVETEKEPVSAFPLLSEEGSALLNKAELLGFVEGSSLGHVSARDSNDLKGKFNKWTRQEFDMDVKSKKDGGRVWEHWCTVRDITPNASVGLSVLKAYLTMVSVSGGRLVSIVARGRRKYSHPEQLAALVKAGFISPEDATIDITPKPISRKAELLIYSAEPKKCLQAARMLKWDEHNISYFMFARRIKDWNTTNRVRNELINEKLLNP